MATQDLDKVMNLLLQNSSAGGQQSNTGSSLNGVLLQALLDGQGRGQPQPAAPAPQPQLAQQLSSFPQAGQQQQQNQQQLENLQLRQQIQLLQQQQARLEEQLMRQQQQAPAPAPQPAPVAASKPEGSDQSIYAILKMLTQQNQQAQQQQQQQQQQAQQQPAAANGELNALIDSAKAEELLKILPALLQSQGQNSQVPAPGHAQSPSLQAKNTTKDPTVSRLLEMLLSNQNAQQGQATGAPAAAASLPAQALSRLPQDLLARHSSFSAAPPAAAASSNNSNGSNGSNLNNLNLMSLAALRHQQQQQQQMQGAAANAPAVRNEAPKNPPSTSAARAVSSSETSSTGSAGSSNGADGAASSSSAGVSSLTTAVSHRDAAGVDASYPLNNIEYPGQHDCMFGRGGGTSNHIGNINFRLLVEKYKKRYAEASKLDKPHVAELVVQQWRAQNPPGRFLTLTNPEEGSLSKWHDVGDKRARRKCAQALREKQGRCRDSASPVPPAFESATSAEGQPQAKKARVN